MRQVTRFLMIAMVCAACGAASGPELSARCGEVELPVSGQPILPDRPLTNDARAALDSVEAVAPGEAGFFNGYRWTIAEESADSITLFGSSMIEPPPDAPRYAHASFSKADGEWRPEGWGQCRIEVAAEGYGSAHWILDRDAEPDPDSNTLEIEIMEQNCANGEAPLGRDILPVISETGNAVSITVFVEPVAGGASCPSNPWHQVVVGLDAPLGDRMLFDGAAIPPIERSWPPSQTSVDSGGRQP
jgi:hypothetical protein